MKKEDLLEARSRLEAFLKPILPVFGRSERRRWGAFYVHGILLEGGRKTAAGMAQRFGGDIQALQQFVNQSPWDFYLVRQTLSRQMMEQVCGPGAWIVDDTGFPKKGNHSVAVARQYTGTLGKIGNCQVAVSLNYATGEGCFPVDFQIYLPQNWIDDVARRENAGIPPEITFKTKWQLAVEMLARARQWGLPEGVVVADAAYGSITEFRRTLQEMGCRYVVGLSPELMVWLEPVVPQELPYSGRGRPPSWKRDLPTPYKLSQIHQQLPEASWQEVTWREGVKGPLKSRFAALQVQPAPGHYHGKVTESVCWLLIEWPPKEKSPIKYWFANLTETTGLQELVFWAKIRWFVEQNYQQLKDELGLDHFEGRSWNGWHHHVTLTMIAFDFLVLEGFRSKKNFWVDPPASQTGTPKNAFDIFGLLPMLSASNHY